MVRKGLLWTGAGTAAVLGGFLAWRFLKGGEQQQQQREGGGGGAAAAGGAE